jgi:hypothetical protein
MTFTQLASRNQNRLTVTASTGRHWPKVQLQESARRARNEEQVVPLSACSENLARNGVNRCGPFVKLANMSGSLNQFVLVKARKSRGGDWLSPEGF